LQQGCGRQRGGNQKPSHRPISWGQYWNKPRNPTLFQHSNNFSAALAFVLVLFSRMD
jgi:hypothetical protein